jgi:hypothetical protein
MCPPLKLSKSIFQHVPASETVLAMLAKETYPLRLPSDCASSGTAVPLYGHRPSAQRYDQSGSESSFLKVNTESGPCNAGVCNPHPDCGFYITV